MGPTRKHAGLTALAMALTISAAAAEPMDSRSARKLLFDPKGRLVEVSGLPGLSDEMNTLLKQALKASAADVRYYGAIAMVPDGGLESEATALAENFHSPAGAEAAALASCNARRAEGTSPCVIVARTLPKGYEPRGLELSVEATEAVRRDLRRARKPRALAVSEATGKWAIASGAGAVEAAVTACNRKAAAAGASDCRAVVAD